MAIIKRKPRISNGRLVQQGDKFRTYEKCWGKAVFLCECGNRVVLSVYDVTRGMHRSCGCMRKENAAITKIDKVLRLANLSQYSLNTIAQYVLGNTSDTDEDKASIYTYVLELTDNCWYVGRTSTPDFRLYTHSISKTVPWIKQHPVVGIHSMTAGDSERQLTLSMMSRYGWERVRGSIWTRVDMDSPPKEL